MTLNGDTTGAADNYKVLGFGVGLGDVLYRIDVTATQNLHFQVCYQGGSGDPILFLTSDCTPPDPPVIAYGDNDNACGNGRNPQFDAVLNPGSYYLIVDGQAGWEGRFNISVTAAGQGVSWVQVVKNAQFSPRGNHSSVDYANEMWVIGGWDGVDRVFDEVWSARTGDDWSPKPPLPNPLFGHSSVVFTDDTQDNIWVICGRNLSNAFNDVFTYDSTSNKWTMFPPNKPIVPPRYFHTSVTSGGRNAPVFVLGGLVNPGNALDDVWFSNTGTDWNKVTVDNKFPARGGHASVMFAGKMYVIGGIDPSKSTIYDDVWSAPPPGNGWNEVTLGSPQKFPARFGHTAMVVGTDIWVIGGRDNTQVFNDAWVSSDGGSKWTQVTDTLTDAPRFGHTNLFFQGFQWVIAGFEKFAPVFLPKNDVWRSP